MLEHLGIGGALDDLVRVIEGRWGGEISLRFDIEPDMGKLEVERALCIHRVAQESIHNAIQHSGAPAMKVVLSATHGRWRLLVSDNGRGFALDETRGCAGLGLLSMRERVNLAGRKPHIRSRPGKGTSVTVELTA